MIHIFILLDAELARIANSDNCAFITMRAAIVGRGEDRDTAGKDFVAAPSVHLIPIGLDLMRAYHTHVVILH